MSGRQTDELLEQLGKLHITLVVASAILWATPYLRDHRLDKAIADSRALVELQRLLTNHDDWLQDHAEASILGRLPVAEIGKILESDRDRRPEKLQILGVEVPSRFVVIGGLAGLCGIQLYLWLHFRMLRARLREHDYELRPWVGLEPDGWCKLAFFMSTIALPVGTVISLCYAQVSEATLDWNTFVVTALAALSVWQALLTFRTWKESLKLYIEGAAKRINAGASRPEVAP